MREFLEEVGSLFEEQCKFKKLKLEKVVTENVPECIISDKKRIKQILMNLLSNALKFTLKGVIKVKFDLTDYDENYSAKDLQKKQ